MKNDRHIQIGGDAAGNTVITGDGNVVIIQTTRVLELERTPFPSAVGPNPYQGLSVFTEREADRFFGRELLTQRLWDVFRALHDSPRGGQRPCAYCRFWGPQGRANRRWPAPV